MKNRILIFVAACFLFATVGCAGYENRLRPDATSYERIPSTAISQNEKTAFGDALKKTVAQNKGESGFRIFERGSQSLMARLALVRLAEKSIDLQYYAIADDETSNLMMEALLQAANRGVRVRLLIDSFTVSDMKHALLAFNGIKNIEVRVFNPLTTHDQSYLSRFAGLFTDLDYADRRMHNKALIADNQMAIMGGRNLSDEYFGADSDMDFKDIDVLTAGPITDDISKSFDKYWNDRNSFPVAAVYKPEHDPEEIQKLRTKLLDNWNQELKNPQRRQQLIAPLPEVLKESDMKLIWAKGELAADDPLKIVKPESPKESEPLDKMVALLNSANHEFLVISAYFVPKQEGVDWLASLEKRGIKIHILTNSLASTDVVAVHSGYAPYRKKLLKAGIDLYELIPINQKRPRQRLLARKQPPRAGLHSKVYVIDGKDTMIGSFNLDPRSVELNTEMAIVIHSPVIAAQIQNLFARAVAPDISYHLSLDQNNIFWHGKEKGQDVIYRHDPHSGFWRNIENFIADVLPVEDEL